MGRIRGFLNEYFCFSRGERNGTFILVALMVVVFIYPNVHGFLKSDDACMIDPELSGMIRAFYERGDHGPDTVKSEPAIVQPAVHAQVHSVPHSSRDEGKIEINEADTMDLMQIKGIGPVLSRRILRYREILGGYNDLTQLLEVYGIDQEKYLEIIPYLSADTTRLKKLNILSGHFGILLRHPYLDYNQVSEIFRLREGGNLNSHDDLMQSTAFSSSDITRLFPYLDFN
jgi:hypothetical protein